MKKTQEIQVSNAISAAVRDVYNQVRLSKRDTERLQKKVLRAVSNEYWAAWIARTSSLKSSQEKYRDGMAIQKDSSSFTAVLTGFLANKVEDGSGPFDLKPILLGGRGVKTSKTGTRYIDIPFLWNTKKDTASAQKLPSTVYKALLSGGGDRLRYSDIPAKYRFIKNKFVRMPDGNARYYKYKTSVFSGIRQGQDSAYRSFRRVSVNSDYRSWIHPGFKAQKLMESAFDDIQFQELVSGIIETYMDKKINQIKTVKKDIKI